jgi:hypothetical protein
MKFALLGAAAVAATALVTPVMAQAVISNPGDCAQYYPEANCQNLGPGGNYQAENAQTNYADMGQPRLHRARGDHHDTH